MHPCAARALLHRALLYHYTLSTRALSHPQAEVAFMEAEAAVAAIKRSGREVLPPLRPVRALPCRAL